MNNMEVLIGRACGQLTQRANNRATGANDEEVGGLLFFGNPMETTPRRLLLDERLSPIDKIGWMAFRMTTTLDRETSFPSYEALQRLLSSRADGSTASRSTVNRVVYILRLTRWLTLCHQARNTLNGRMVGNIYSLHDEPISIVDASRFDAGYITFVHKCRSHGHQSVRKVAQIVFQELIADQNAHHLMTQVGKPFTAATVAALHGAADDVEYSFIDCTVIGSEAEKLVNRCSASVTAGKKVLICFRIGDIWSDAFTYTKGEKKGQPGASLKGRLLFISWIKIDGKLVYQAKPRDEQSKPDHAAADSFEEDFHAA